MKFVRTACAPLAAALVLAAGQAAGSPPPTAPPSRGLAAAGVSDARIDLRQAVQVVHDMKSDPRVARLLRDANGVLVLPDYGRAALGLGIQAGEGVLVTRHGRTYSDPAFFDLAGISLGLQAGVSGGPVALLLMTDRAVQQFRSNRRLSLDAAAGLTIAAYSARHQVSQGRLQDVIVWSGTDGLYAGAALGVTDIVADAEANRAYYGRHVTPNEILGGLVDNPHPNVLGLVLAI
ncbi:lipid-binding SYLF domain-containing protein [Ramlibacter sp. AN1133]|uniref:lipid-binding SYLF domain-containing protein n=1 Tax=Ramlibacter sp. AN1133 TaxID=3133429 RepID=UPI0030BE4A32